MKTQHGKQNFSGRLVGNGYYCLAESFHSWTLHVCGITYVQVYLLQHFCTSKRSEATPNSIHRGLCNYSRSFLGYCAADKCGRSLCNGKKSWLHIPGRMKRTTSVTLCWCATDCMEVVIDWTVSCQICR